MTTPFQQTILVAIQTELAKPDTRKAIIGIEDAVLKVAEGAIDTLIPPVIRPFIQPLIDHFAEKGITAIEHLTDEALASLGPVQVQVGTTTLALTVAKPKAYGPTQEQLRDLQPDDRANWRTATGNDGHDD